MIYRKLGEMDVLSQNQVEQIHKSSLKVLQKNGIEIYHEDARRIMAKYGAKVEGNRVFFPPELVEENLAMAPEKFTLHARNPQKNVIVGGKNTVIAPGYGAPFVMDMDKKKRRNSTFEDYLNFTKLAGHSSFIDVVGGVLVEPTDVPDRLRHGRMFYAGARYTDKCLMGSALGAQKARESVEMAAILHGGLEFIKEHPTLISLININSPLELDQRMTDALMVYARYKQPMIIASLSMTGTTAPATLVGALVQQNAEIIAGITLAQTVNPGTPVVYGSASSVIDLKTGNLAIGSPETAKMFGGTAQMARFYQIPSRGGGSLTDALIPDAQSGYESMMVLMAAVMSGFHFILHGAGLLENYMTMSYEKFIMDEELLRMLSNFCSGLEFSEDTLAVDTILKVGSGGHYLAEEHTYRHMRSLGDPVVSLRQRYLGEGKLEDTLTRASALARQLIVEYKPTALDESIEKELQTYINDLG